MTIQKQKIKRFISKWQGRGKEDEDDRSFWIDLLQDVFELTKITDRLDFQKKVIGSDGNTKRIDVYIPETRVLIEQKSLGIALDKPQAGHKGMTPYQQAKMYDNGLRTSEKARWIVTSNFAEIWIYNMDTSRPEDSVTKISIDNLDREYNKLSFLYDPQIEQIRKETEISKEAGLEIGKIYDALLKQYSNKPSKDDLKNLNAFCVRLVFCYYAEDAGLFDNGLFSKYIASFNPQHLRTGLKQLFRILNTKEADRDPYEEKALLAFPYVNGGLFNGENDVIPQIDENIKETLLSASDFDWSDISPTIFGAIFESTLNQDTRTDLGMHYTSIENIHKVIDPLFLNDLKSELEDIKASKQPNVRVQKLRAYQDKLASLTFLDPACGSGNFLTETYLSLRKLENDVISTLNINQIGIIGELSASPIKVQLNQFYGIEINDFAVSVARTALWIAENQMMEKTKEIIVNADYLNFLPLKSFTNIKEGNALRIDWDSISTKKCSYVMGNPPFVGSSKKDAKDEQKKDMALVFDEHGTGKLDYVAAWYKKAAIYIQNTNIRCAFVSTNSITQGEQVSLLWKLLFEKFNIEIIFAYSSFKWKSESKDPASVVCVIVGFALKGLVSNKVIIDGTSIQQASHINGYLLNMDDLYIKSRSEQLNPGMEKMIQGNKPWDGGNLILSEAEAEELKAKYPQASSFIKPFYGGNELIKGKKRYCLWLKGVSPALYNGIPEIKSRLKAVREVRLEANSVKELANTPMLFTQIRQPDSDYLAVPEVSTSSREYIPIGFLTKNDIASNKLFIIPNATHYYFGIMESRVHMIWMEVVSGKLGTGFSYSPSVYNNFPWPNVSDDTKTKIAQTARGILDARNLYPDCSLYQLYDVDTMPPELLSAHQKNDREVMKAFGFKLSMTDTEIMEALMKLYQKLIKTA